MTVELHEPCPAGIVQLLAVIVALGVVRLNVAVTFFAEFMVTLQVPVPEQSPLQPENIEPLSAVAVNVTDVSGG